MAGEHNNESTNQIVHFIALDCEACRLGLIDEDITSTLVAVASEDPADWCEMLAYWPRYSSRVVPEFLSSVPLEIVPKEALSESVRDSQLWIVVDLVKKRVVTGKAIQLFGRDAGFAMYTDENGNQHDPLDVHLPPWWELEEQVDFETIDRPRQNPRKAPTVDREVLFGRPMVHAIATHALKFATEGRVAEAIEQSNSQTHDPFYDLTIEVHRDWLMTPREDLGGLCPRQMLHGGIDWIDKLTWAQRMRFEARGSAAQIVAAPKECSGYRHGPMGREEMATYFDLCRELIKASWSWCQRNFSDLSTKEKDATSSLNSIDAPSKTAPIVDATDDLPQVERQRQALIGYLEDVKLDWLTSPLEDDSAPAFILECSRRRVPRGAGVEIVGMDERQQAEHIIDCDCPICIMMAEGKMGVGFCGIDGHHLDLDGEFAFSMHETREAWEAEQREHAAFAAKFEREREERKRQADEGETEPDEFASAWSGGVSQKPIPGDASGHLKLAFLFAELVSEIKQAKVPEDPNSDDLASAVLCSDELVSHLNAFASKFRNSGGEGVAENAKLLTNTLEQIAEARPDLRPRVADLQSRVAETARGPIDSSDLFSDTPGDDDELPF